MPPRPKRNRLHPARATRSKAQVLEAPSEPAATDPGPSRKETTNVAPGPATRRTRSNMIMEVVLPASKKPTPKTSSVPTPVSPSPELETATAKGEPMSSPPVLSPPAREPTPKEGEASTSKGTLAERLGSLPPSSPPPNSSPQQGFEWDRSSDPVFSTPTPSPSRSRQASRQNLLDQTALDLEEALVEATVLVPATSSSQHSATAHLPTPPSDPRAPPSNHPSLHSEPAHKPPTSPVPYSDTAAADDPFGFLAAEDRLRERRAALEIDRDQPSGWGSRMPSSGGAEGFDESTYEEAFASIFYDPNSGTITAMSGASDKENEEVEQDAGKGKARSKRMMEVVIPTKGKGKERANGNDEAGEKEKEKETEAKPTRGKGKGKEKREHVLTTYELEAMLPRRPTRARKLRAKEEAEKISLSDIDDEESESDKDEAPKRRKRSLPTRGKAARGGVTGKVTATKAKEVKPAPKRDTKPVTKSASTTRGAKRVRSGDTAHMDGETLKRFEAEKKRRLEQYKALDGYTLEEEEVVW
ncbi:hypothetical protein BDV93DRAFT_519361 [Ceratobasidium sp. AG-I]|nr:hypothetical protein BDV93DRAFT_519361 [Ceratobasidium sp. AG-I]